MGDSWYPGCIDQIFIWASPLLYIEVLLHAGMFDFRETHIFTHQLQIPQHVLPTVQFLKWCYFSLDRDVWARFDYFVSFVLTTLWKMRGKGKDKNDNKYNFCKCYLAETRLRVIKCLLIVADLKPQCNVHWIQVWSVVDKNIILKTYEILGTFCVGLCCWYILLKTFIWPLL